MTRQPSSQPDITTERYPLSFTQQYLHSLDEGDPSGAFGNRFTIVPGVRIAGHVDVGMLQTALDDVVEHRRAASSSRRASRNVRGAPAGMTCEDA
jgi:hypothetical protein